MWNWLGDEFFIHAFEEILLSSNRHFEVVNCSKQFVRTRILTTQSKVKASLPYWMHLSVFSICIIRFKISRMQFIWYLQYVQLQKSGHRSPGTNKDPPSIPKTCLQCLMKTNNIRQFDHVIRFTVLEWTAGIRSDYEWNIHACCAGIHSKWFLHCRRWTFRSL